MIRGTQVVPALLAAALGCGGQPVARAAPRAVPSSVDDVTLARADISWIHIGELTVRTRQHGLEIEPMIRSAAGGIRAALDSVLAAAAWIGPDTLHPIPAYPMVLLGLLETVGDNEFNAALLRASSEGRYHATALLRDAGTIDRARFPLVFMTDSSIVRPRAPRGEDDPVIESDLVENRPEIIQGSCAMPAYPEALRQYGRAGRAVLEFVIGSNGSIERGTTRVVASSHPDVSRAAANAARSCRYRPGTVNGTPVRVLVQQPLIFRVAR